MDYSCWGTRELIEEIARLQGKPIRILRDLIAYEEHALEEMKAGNANIPEGWGIDQQRGYVAGLRHAYSEIQSALKQDESED